MVAALASSVAVALRKAEMAAGAPEEDGVGMQSSKDVVLWPWVAEAATPASEAS